MRVLFLGNHTVGVRVLRAMESRVEVCGVVAHPPDAEDGVRYLSVHDFARERGWPVIRGKANSPEVLAFIHGAHPDLLWSTDYRYLLPQPLIDAAPLGAVNLHPSLLPKYRGRAPVNWAILQGETTLGLTAHFIDQGMDTGDIIDQVTFELGPDKDVGDALELLYPLYEKITTRVLELFQRGEVPRHPQNHAAASAFPRRTAQDGLIRWDQSAAQVVNLVRAVAAPYPGAFTEMDGHKFIVWRASATNGGDFQSREPGQVVALTPEGIVVACREGCVLLKKFEFAETTNSPTIREGSVLGR